MTKQTWCSRILAAALATWTAIGAGACLEDAGEREDSELWEGDEEVGEVQQAVFTNRPLAMGTATYSQSGYSVDEAIDGDAWGADSGWGIFVPPADAQSTPTQHACFELASGSSGDTPSGKTTVRFRLKFGRDARHHLGAFKLYLTTSPKNTFANGADTGGNCYSGPGGSAAWKQVLLSDVQVSAAAGNPPSLSVGEGQYIIADSCDDATDVEYVVTGMVNADRITGALLTAIDLSSTDVAPHLPTGGPGCAADGNIVLTDFKLSTQPIN